MNNRVKGEAYARMMKNKGVQPEDPKAWRLTLNTGDIAAVSYPNGARYPVKVTRLTSLYVWVQKIYEGDSRGNEEGYSLTTGFQFCAGSLKPSIVPATDAEKEEAATKAAERLR